MIRPMTFEDVDQVYFIENQSFFQPWSKEMLLNEMKINKFLEYYVYEENDEILGFYIANYILDEAELYTLAVREDSRDRGIGTKLIGHLEKRSKLKKMSKIFLEVSTKNQEAIKLYEKFSFKIVGLRKNYYSKTNEDAYVMRKDII
ncbi:MAG: ribosomal protein S18-alanine N-acetyltransferase [Peptoniphilaceae bacterium]|nr:ribosomal protein S18-alanine N-acetyltransferase [Peptoniphilaceae bacterium]MDY6019345.1 ribosomal protein S18-alanine N-acetyltransferase [Anaerococcus sp.]